MNLKAFAIAGAFFVLKGCYLMATILEALQRAVSLQNSGKIDDAAHIYRAVLEVDQSQPDALHLLGLILSQQGEHSEAIKLVRRALEKVPSNPTFHSNYGVVLRRAGKFDEAIEAYEKSIQLAPKSADAYFNLGKALKLVGKTPEARDRFDHSRKLNPKKAEAWVSLSNTFVDEGDYETAHRLLVEALSYRPDSCELHISCGVVLKRLQRIEESLSCYKKAVEIGPTNIEALCKLANAFVGQNRLDSAEGLVKRAQEVAPKHHLVLNAAGLVAKSKGDYDTAIACYQEALIQKPDFSVAIANLGVSQRQRGDISAALANLQRALELDSENVESKVNLAATSFATGRFEHAVKLFREVLEKDPRFVDADDNYLMCLQYHPEFGIAEIYNEHKRWNELHARGKEAALPKPRGHNERIKIGFVSADLGNHPVGYFTHLLFEYLDKDQFELVVYSDRIGLDELGQELRSLADEWHETLGLSHSDLADLIRRNRIDVLFDLAGHTAQHRLLTFAQRAAPIQVSWAGYVGTTGLAQMDYLLADRFHCPEVHDSYYSEEVLRMPNGYICYSPPSYAPKIRERDWGASPAVSFGVVANPAKVNEYCLRLWNEILVGFPDSRIVFCYKGWTDKVNKERVFEVLNGVGKDRIRFEFRDGHQNMLEYYNEIDIALDTFPYSGGLTACEALWMGVPTITLPKDKFCSRHSLSHLSNVGLTELIADDENDYVEKAIELAADRERLCAYRNTLRVQTASSTLCDGKQFASDFGNLINQLFDTSTRSNFD